MPLPGSEQSMKQGPMRKGSSNDFQTPVEALWPLIPYLPKDWTIWECAAGMGNLVTGFEKLGYKVIATDILEDTGFGVKDFITWEPPKEEYQCIVTNPPYSLKQEFLERCYELGKPFALLVPLTTFETPKRQRLFEKYGVQVIFFDKRINFQTPSGGGTGAWFATAWFTNLLHLPKDMNFVRFKDIKQVPLEGFNDKANNA